ncbi:hypothetical protein BMS3Bbin02_00733 [bacterium BMS3Bbin02]|nr:hypothetical protein BMS3Bbin02_00733 [bacterium BMS3Bbin02]
MDISCVTKDLVAEQDALDDIVAHGRGDVWSQPTPSIGWTVADQIGHLTYFDHAAAIAITDPAAFSTMVTELFSAVSDESASFDDITLGRFRAMAPATLLEEWRSARYLLAGAAATLADHTRVDWYGPSMSARSFLTARLMEVWAHGQDIVDAVGAQRILTDRLAHIAQLGFITRQWSYKNRGLSVPDGDVLLKLVAPSGEIWEFGPESADDEVAGPAVDFCLVVTQRRHVDDTALIATPQALEWLRIAQAFAGPPTDGPAARTVTL